MRVVRIDPIDGAVSDAIVPPTWRPILAGLSAVPAASVMAVLLSAALPVWQTMVRRERETELIFRGEQYAHAAERAPISLAMRSIRMQRGHSSGSPWRRLRKCA